MKIEIYDSLPDAAAEVRKNVFINEQGFKEEFYEKMGFDAYGNEDEDEGCPHIWMQKNIV